MFYMLYYNLLVANLEKTKESRSIPAIANNLIHLPINECIAREGMKPSNPSEREGN